MNKQLTVRIDEEVHRRTKARLAKENKSFQELIEGLLIKWLSN